MGSMDIIKPLSTVLRNAVNKSQQYREKNSWECRESNSGLLGEKQVCYLCAKKFPFIGAYLGLPDLLIDDKFVLMTGMTTLF